MKDSKAIKETEAFKGTKTQRKSKKPIDQFHRFMDLPRNIRILVYQSFMKNFAANYAAHVSEKLQPLAGNMPIRQSVIDLVLLPCNTEDSQRTQAMEKESLALTHACLEIRSEFRPLLIASTHVHVPMKLFEPFLKAFFDSARTSTAFNHVMLLFLDIAKEKQKNFNVLPIMDKFNRIPGLQWSVTDVAGTSSSGHSAYDSLFARQNSLLAYVLSYCDMFNRISYGLRYLAICIKHGYGQPWMDLPWKVSDYRRVRGLPADMASRQLATRTWLTAAGVDVSVVKTWSVAVGTMGD